MRIVEIVGVVATLALSGALLVHLEYTSTVVLEERPSTLQTAGCALRDQSIRFGTIRRIFV